MKGCVVGTAAICVLLSLLSIVGYAGLLDARSIADQPLPASASIAGTPPSLAAAAGPHARDTLSGSTSPGSTRDDNYSTTDLSTYLFFHQTWHRTISTPIAPGSSTCPDRP